MCTIYRKNSLFICYKYNNRVSLEMPYNIPYFTVNVIRIVWNVYNKIFILLFFRVREPVPKYYTERVSTHSLCKKKKNFQGLLHF